MQITAINDETEYVLHMDRGEYLILMTAMGAASRSILEDVLCLYDDFIQDEIRKNINRNFDIYGEMNDPIGHRI